MKILTVFLLFISLPAMAFAPPDTLDVKIQQAAGVAKAEALYEAISYYSRRDIAKAQKYIADSYTLAAT